MDRAGQLIDAVVAWAVTRADIRAVALVGSHARAAARPESDIDLMILTTAPDAYRRDPDWATAIVWPTGTMVGRRQDEDWGAAWSRRLWLDPAAELDVCFAAPSWAATDPVDPGTRAVIAGGLVVRHDPDGLLARLLAVTAPQRP